MTRPKKLKIGTVYNNYSNYLLMMIADARAARGWQANEHPGYEPVRKLYLEDKEARIALEGGEGSLVSVGGCGISDVFQLAEDDFVIPEHYSDDWNPDIEAQFMSVITQPLGKEVRPFSSIEIKSGMLALLHAGDPAEKFPNTLTLGETQKVEGGMIIGVPNGRYDIFKETLDAKGGYGSIESRLRIVASSSVEKARAAVSTKPATEKAAENKTQAQVYATPEGMQFIEDLALSSDGAYLVAGEKGGVRVAVWSTATGKLLWSKSLVRARTDSRFWQNVQLSVYEGLLVVGVSGTAAAAWTLPEEPERNDSPGKLAVFDLKTGALQAEHALSEQVSFVSFIASPQNSEIFHAAGPALLIGHLPEVYVMDWKSGTIRHKIEAYCGGTYSASLSPDGKVLLVAGSQLHFCDPSTFEVKKTIKENVSRPAFSPDGQFIAGGIDKGAIEIRDREMVKKIASFPAPSKVHETGIGGIVWSPDGKTIAVAYEDGYVRLWDVTKKKVVQEFKGHDTTIPDTGARSLEGLAWSPDGKILYVGGAQKGTYGVSAYTIGNVSR